MSVLAGTGSTGIFLLHTGLRVNADIPIKDYYYVISTFNETIT